MRNKLNSLSAILLLVAVSVCAPVWAETPAAKGQVKVKESAIKLDSVSTPDTTVKEDAVKAENRRRLEEDLNNTSVAGKAIVDFPNRSSLGSLELAPLPGINDSSVGGPLPMAPSVSGKDLPNEQLLGHITPEVFQEMADLERGNTFLKLQVEKEKLKNDLEQLKSTYRKQRLEEIAKREDVVRNRIQWWQEQEKIRLEIEKKQAEEEELSQKIAQQEATRDQIREEARQRMNQQAAAQASQVKEGEDAEDVVVEVTPVTMASVEDMYTLNSVQGVGGDLKAKLISKDDGTVLTVQVNDILPSGHVVREISKDKMTVAFGNKETYLIFKPGI